MNLDLLIPYRNSELAVNIVLQLAVRFGSRYK